VKVLKITLPFFLLFLSQAAMSAEPVFGGSTENKYLREIPAPKGKAVVYVYQRETDGSGASPTIWLNNYEIGRLVPGSFTIWQLAPGKLTLRVDGAEAGSFSLISEAGKIYLFRVLVTQTAAGPKAQLMRMPDSYRNDLAAAQLLKNPRDVTSVAAQPIAKPAESAAVAAQELEKTPMPSSKTTISPGGMGLIFKLGTFTLSEENQTILSNTRNFDSSASSPYALEAYYQFDSGLALGGELISYTANFSTVGFNDKYDVDVLLLLANAKQYFRTQSSLQPYLGAGLGVAATDVNVTTVDAGIDPVSGNTSSIAYQILAGVEYRSSSVGVFGEVKYIGADTEDKAGEKIDVSGTGIFGGVAFHF